MATGQTDELMRILNFNDQELALNRQGKLGFEQRLRLLEEVNQFMIVVIALIPFGIIVWVNDHQPILEVIGLLVLLGVIVAFNQPSVQILLDIVNGQVSEVSGAITIRLYTRSQRTLLGLIGEKFADGTINDVTFLIPVEMVDEYQGRPMRIFYSPRYHRALSGEVLVKIDDLLPVTF